MRNPHGHASTTCNDTGKVLEEFDTLTCCHCNGWFPVPTKTTALKDMPGFCRMCMSNTCPTCCTKGTCTPFLKKLEAFERRERMRAAILGT